MISEAALEELKALYWGGLGITLSADEVRERGQRLLMLADLASSAHRAEIIVPNHKKEDNINTD